MQAWSTACRSGSTTRLRFPNSSRQSHQPGPRSSQCLHLFPAIRAHQEDRSLDSYLSIECGRRGQSTFLVGRMVSRISSQPLELTALRPRAAFLAMNSRTFAAWFFRSVRRINRVIQAQSPRGSRLTPLPGFSTMRPLVLRRGLKARFVRGNKAISTSTAVWRRLETKIRLTPASKEAMFVQPDSKREPVARVLKSPQAWDDLRRARRFGCSKCTMKAARDISGAIFRAST